MKLREETTHLQEKLFLFLLLFLVPQLPFPRLFYSVSKPVRYFSTPPVKTASNAGCVWQKRNKSPHKSQMRSTKGAPWTLLRASRNEPCRILMRRSVRREALEETLLNLGARTSQTDRPCWDSRGTEKQNEREKAESLPHSQTCHPCQVHVKVAWEGKEGMAFSVKPGQHKERLMMCPDTCWQGWTDNVSSVENSFREESRGWGDE